jgi:hypothetical protein
VRQVHSATEKANGSKGSSPTHGESSNLANGDLESNHVVPGLSAEYIAAVRIQDAFRAYKVHFNGVIIHTYIYIYIYIEGAFIFYFFGPMNQPFDYDKKKIKNMAATASFVSAFFTGQLLMAVASFCMLKSPPAYNG